MGVCHWWSRRNHWKYIHGIEYQDEIIIVDAGVRIPRGWSARGYVTFDYSYIVENIDRVKTLLITTDEDHIGGGFRSCSKQYPYLCRSLALAEVIRKTRKEHGLCAMLHFTREESTTTLSWPLKILNELFRTTHSIPEPLGCYPHLGKSSVPVTLKVWEEKAFTQFWGTCGLAPDGSLWWRRSALLASLTRQMLKCQPLQTLRRFVGQSIMKDYQRSEDVSSLHPLPQISSVSPASDWCCC